jgi:hypothetical protein
MHGELGDWPIGGVPGHHLRRIAVEAYPLPVKRPVGVPEVGCMLERRHVAAELASGSSPSGQGWVLVSDDEEIEVDPGQPPEAGLVEVLEPHGADAEASRSSGLHEGPSRCTSAPA